VKPTESLVYNEIKQNTKPPLDSIDDEELVEFYPFLPYHAPLFLEILFNLRQEASDPAKSIFSGTARAILALMHNLLQTWVDEGRPTRSSHSWSSTSWSSRSSEILTRRICESVIEGSGGGEPRKSQTKSRTVILRSSISTLQSRRAAAPARPRHRPAQRGEYCGFSDVGSQRTLWISTQNRVEESLGRLQKFIRPMADETGARYRFATQEERIIYDDTEANEDDPDWDAVLHALDEHLWGRITQDLSPRSRFRTVTLVTSIPLCMGSASTALVSRPRSTLRADSTYQSSARCSSRPYFREQR